MILCYFEDETDEDVLQHLLLASSGVLWLDHFNQCPPPPGKPLAPPILTHCALPGERPT